MSRIKNIMTLAQALAQEWKIRLQEDYPNHSSDVHNSIICWLLGNNSSKLESLAKYELYKIFYYKGQNNLDLHSYNITSGAL